MVAPGFASSFASGVRRRERGKKRAMASRPEKLTQFEIDKPVPGYWRVVFSNLPVNLLTSR